MSRVGVPGGKSRDEMNSGKSQILIAGVGGQGVLFATKLVLETAKRMGNPVIGSETHGMSQRGGSVVSTVKIGEFRNPLVARGGADLLIALQKDESYRNLPFVRRGGGCVVNAADSGFLDPAVRSAIGNLGISFLALDADGAAREIGAPLSSNLVCLGFSLAKRLLPFESSDWRSCIEEISPGKFRPSNLAAFDKGFSMASAPCPG